jgi:hypothetical protein
LSSERPAAPPAVLWAPSPAPLQSIRVDLFRWRKCRVVCSAIFRITGSVPKPIRQIQRCHFVVQDNLAIFTVLLSALVSACASYITARISQARQQRRATENYKLALVSEIRALHKHLIRYETLFHERVLTGQATAAQLLKVLLQPGDTVVFTNNASAIGLFRNRTALRVLRFYSDVRTLHGHAIFLSELVDDEPGHTREQMLRHQAMLRHARRRAHALVKCLKRTSLADVALGRLRRGLRGLRRVCRKRARGGSGPVRAHSAQGRC